MNVDKSLGLNMGGCGTRQSDVMGVAHCHKVCEASVRLRGECSACSEKQAATSLATKAAENRRRTATQVTDFSCPDTSALVHGQLAGNLAGLLYQLAIPNPEHPALHMCGAALWKRRTHEPRAVSMSHGHAVSTTT